MPNGQRSDPYGNFNFRVEIDGITVGSFSKVVMSQEWADVIEYREGTDLGPRSRKLPGRIHHTNITLERGLTANVELYVWWTNVKAGLPDRRNASVILMDSQHRDVIRWNLIEALPVKYELSALEAKGSEVVIERLELAIEGFERE